MEIAILLTISQTQETSEFLAENGNVDRESDKGLRIDYDILESDFLFM